MTTRFKNHTNKACQNFSKHASDYASNSAAQQEIAKLLLKEIPQNRTPQTILEIGCGTGYLTQCLADLYPNTHITATDISSAMLQEAKRNWPNNQIPPKWQILDGQTLQNLTGHYDIIISNMCIQWLEDINTAYKKWQQHLTPHGYILTSRPSANAFWQWKDALTSLSLPHGIIRYQETPYTVKTVNLQKDYGATYTFLRTIKASGAATPAQNYQNISPKALKKACDTCDAMYNGQIDWEITLDKIHKTQ